MNRTATLLGFAARAGELVSGENTCRARIRRIHLVLLSGDAPERTRRHFEKLKPGACYTWGDRNELGRVIGKSPRTVVGITDPRFARSIRDSLK